MPRSTRPARKRRAPAVIFGLLAAGCATADGDFDQGPIPLTLENIFTAGGGAGRVALSPDGSTLAGAGPAEGSGGRGIHLIPTRATAEVSGPAGGDAGTFWTAGGSQVWSPDGARLAFVRGGSLFVATPGEAGRAVAEGFGGLRAPSWSPDGATLAYYSTDSGSQDIWLVDADGATPPRQLTTAAAEADDSRFSPSWSPDGRWIAYISNRADWWHDDVWLIDVATRDASRISTSLMASSSPVWSPDGSSLVLMGTAKDEYWYEDLAYLYRIDLDLSGTASHVVREAPIEMQVYATDAIMRFDPFWSGDGERVYFPYQQRRRLRPLVGARRGRSGHPRHEHRRRMVVVARDAGRHARRIHARRGGRGQGSLASRPRGRDPRTTHELLSRLRRDQAADGDLLQVLRRPLHPGIPVPAARDPGRPFGRLRPTRLPGARPGPRGRDELLHAGDEPHRAVPRERGIRRPGD